MIQYRLIWQLIVEEKQIVDRVFTEVLPQTNELEMLLANLMIVSPFKEKLKFQTC